MSKTLLNVNTTDTFQVWLQRTNDLVNELKTSIVTASLSGDTTVGSAVLTANFSANTVIGRNFLRTNALDSIAVGDTISVLSRTNFTPPVSTGVSITQSSGPKVIYDNNSIRWLAGIRGSTGTGTGSEFIIGPEGTTDYSLRITSAGTVYANTIVLGSDSSSATAAVRADRSITTINGITGGGNLTANRELGLTGTPLSLFNLSTNGLVARTASGTVNARTLTEGTGITIANGNGVSGNPTISVDATSVMLLGTAQTVTGNKTFSGLTTFNGNVQMNGNTVVSQGDNISFDGKIVLSSNTTNGIVSFGGSGTYFKSLNANTSIYFQDSTSTTKLTLNTASGNLIVAGDVLAYSDSRLKSNIRQITNAVDKVSAMRGVYFDKDGRTNVGVIAQEIEEVLPEVVINGDDGYKSVAYGNITGLLIEAVKEMKMEMKKEIEELKAVINKMKEGDQT